MVLKVFPKGDFLGLLICCSQKNSDQETLKIPFVAISFKSNFRLTGLGRGGGGGGGGRVGTPYSICGNCP